MLVVDRAQVLAHRVAVQGLLRDRPPDRILRLGVQHAGPSVALALAARTPVVTEADDEPRRRARPSPTPCGSCRPSTPSYRPATGSW